MDYMKKWFFLLVVAGLLVLVGCDKAKEAVTAAVADEITTADVASSVAASLGSTSTAHGFTYNSVKASSMMKDMSSTTLSKDTTFQIVKSTATYTYNYLCSLHAEMKPLTNLLYFDLNSRGNIYTPQISSSDSAEIDITVKNIAGSNPNYFISGVYSRTGEISPVRNKTLLMKSTQYLYFDTVLVSKDSLILQKAHANISISYTAAGKSITIDGTLVYLNDEYAILTLNNTSYYLDLEKGLAVLRMQL